MNAVIDYREITRMTALSHSLVKSSDKLDLSEGYIYDDPVKFLEHEFYIPETGQPIVLTDHQREVIRTAFQQIDGKFVYTTIIYSSIKKSAKTFISAGLALWHAFRYPYGRIYIVGNDLKQANSRAAEAIRIAIQLHPVWRDTVKVKPSGYMVTLPNNSQIEAIPVDPHGEAGMNPSAVIWTEAWAVRHDAALKLWTETTLSPTRQGESFRLVESYAGYSGESPLLERLYESGVKEGERIHPDIEIYANRAASMFTYWNTQYRLPWQTDSYYAEQAAILTPNEFDRVHRNQWVTSENVFVPGEWWDACRGDYPEFDDRAAVVIGLDAGVSSDCFALVGVSRIGEVTYPRFCRIWKPPKGSKINFSDIEKCIREELIPRYNVVQIAYDPYQTHDLATRLRDVVWTFEFTQGAPRLEADKQLFDCIRDRRIIHNGDSVLTEHIKNANSKSEGEVDKLRIVKRSESLKIDAAVALSMANSEARRLNL
jgi:phage terminase large subunit-like protein